MNCNVINKSNNSRAYAIIGHDHVRVYSNAKEYQDYDSIQVFANHWQFIEDEQPMELLNPQVITLIKYWCKINKITKIMYVLFKHYDDHDTIWIDGLLADGSDSYANQIEMERGLLDFDKLEEYKDYKPEDLEIVL